MRGVRAAAIIMTLVMIAEGAPLVYLATGPRGLAPLAALLGFGAPTASLLAWGAALLVALGYAALSMTSLPFIREHVLDIAPIKLWAVLFAFITGTFEELFFRQWLMNSVQARGMGIAVQVIASGVIFGLAHGVWGLLGRNLVAAWRATLYTTGLGLALALVFVLSDRTLAPAAWSHILINLIIEPWLLLGVMNLRPARNEVMQ